LGWRRSSGESALELGAAPDVGSGLRPREGWGGARGKVGRRGGAGGRGRGGSRWERGVASVRWWESGGRRLGSRGVRAWAAGGFGWEGSPHGRRKAARAAGFGGERRARVLFRRIGSARQRGR
jgi:hypothetical protein